MRKGMKMAVVWGLTSLNKNVRSTRGNDYTFSEFMNLTYRVPERDLRGADTIMRD